MPRYVPINDNLCLIEQEIKTKKVVVKKGPTSHIWIYDRSGSMSGTLPELCTQLIGLSKKLPKGDNLSLGWFSDEGGKYDWIFKGFKITESSDYKALEAAIKKNSTTIGCTCFSEILEDTSQVIADLSVLSKVFSLHFFTDGYPVVSNYSKETAAIFAAIKKIKGKVQSAMLVGYGWGYNKPLMAEMAEKLGAALIHSSMIPEYSNSITKLIDLSQNSEPKEEVEPLVNKPLALFTITDQGVLIYSIDEDGKIYVSPQQDKSTLVYYVSNEKPNKKSWDKVEVSAINFGDKDDQLSKALYASALVLTQQTKTDVALELIGKSGDKAIVDQLNNAFQVEEYGVAEQKILEAIQDVSLRFINGRDPNYLPAPDAFCVFDMLNILTSDDQAAFFPYDPRFKYERIGVATKSKDDYPTFKPDKASKCPFNTLTWHESRLNLSVQTKVNGTIELKDVGGKSAANYGFPNPYPTYVFRNFSFVKDGHTHLKMFYLTSSEATYTKFKNQGIVVDDTFKTDGIYGLDISKLPAINRAIAIGKTSATALCKSALKEQKLKAEIKALKWLKDEELGEDKEVPAQFTPEQATFLEVNGILVNRGCVFSPPTEKEDPKDFYMAKYFDIKLSGIASLPPAKKVMEKITQNKPRTAVEALMEKGITQWTSIKSSMKDKKATTTWFSSTLEQKQKELKEVRSDLQKTKFAVIIGKRWFDEWQTRENCSLTIDNVNCVFDLGEERVPV